MIERVLGDDYVTLGIGRLVLEEITSTSKSTISLTLLDSQSGDPVVVEGQGTGLVDALFAALVRRFSREYPSLDTLELSGLSIDAHVDTKQGRGTDSTGEVTLDMRNSRGTIFQFSATSRSISLATTLALLKMIEFFINAERAFISLATAVQDAQERGRDDLVARFTLELGEIVLVTSYSDALNWNHHNGS